MRGLPSCGKSRKARELAGLEGIVCETDEFFEVESGGKTVYKYDADRLVEARDWNFQRFCDAATDGHFPIVVDRGNGLNLETQRYARFAVDHGYTVALAEPDSPWWQEIRVLLKYRPYTNPVLDDWADRLTQMNRRTHRTPEKTIRRWMAKWDNDVTVARILRYHSAPEPCSAE